MSIVSLNEYNLFLNVDTNTKGHSQWFYFAVTNTDKDRTVVFNILNCTKPISLFKYGMKPLVFSEAANEESGAEWLPDTSNAFYTRNEIPKNPPVSAPGAEESICLGTYYTLTFSHTFKHPGDRVYFAYSQPYAVSMHCAVLREIQDSLISESKNFVLLEEDGLQKRIKEFVETEEKNKSPAEEGEETKKVRRYQEEDQFARLKQGRRGGRKGSNSPLQNPRQPAAFPEANLVAAEVLKEYGEAGRGKRFDWIKGQDFQVETETYIYRQETLCHTFSGFPVELITITAHWY